MADGTRVVRWTVPMALGFGGHLKPCAGYRRRSVGLCFDFLVGCYASVILRALEAASSPPPLDPVASFSA